MMLSAKMNHATTHRYIHVHVYVITLMTVCEGKLIPMKIQK